MRATMKYQLVLAAAASTMFYTTTAFYSSETDVKIEASFKGSYVYRTFLKEYSIRISCRDGVFTLTGVVSEESHKRLAQDTAESLFGVIRVINHLETKADVAAERSDNWIARKVKFTLLLHRNVRAAKTHVEVKERVVTLTGTASSLAQKELTGEYAADIDGVGSVTNLMTVVEAAEPPTRSAAERMDDASVTAQVRTALLSHRSTNGLGTMVATRDGAVTITGIAKNAAEKSLVTKLVSGVKGVSTARNEMTVESSRIR